MLDDRVLLELAMGCLSQAMDRLARKVLPIWRLVPHCLMHSTWVCFGLDVFDPLPRRATKEASAVCCLDSVSCTNELIR